MHVWLDLILRELLFVALLTALGLGPATFLPKRYDPTSRFALAPALGLSIGVCAGVTLAAVAKALGIEIRSGRVVAEGDLDFRGTLGVSKETPVGFTDIRLRFEVDTSASTEQQANLLRLAERYCVIYQTLKNPPRLSATIGSAQSS